MLKAVRHRKVSDQVYEQIRDMIYRGEMRQGEQLQPERDMAAMLGVGRPAVREAIQKLIERGLVESRRGVGNFVRNPGEMIESSPLLQLLEHEEFTLLDFLEVRTALECKSAELAARRATDEDIQLIERSLAPLKPVPTDKKKQINDDVAFHMNIAYSSKNIVQVHLMKSFYDVQSYTMNMAYFTLLEKSHTDPLIFNQHVRIFESIRDHDWVEAHDAMETHLRTVVELCRKSDLPK